MPVKKTAEKTAALAEVRSLLPRSVHAEEARERFTRRTDPRIVWCGALRQKKAAPAAGKAPAGKAADKKEKPAGKK
jgi:hypothetical protein